MNAFRVGINLFFDLKPVWGFSLNAAKDFSLRGVKTRIDQPGKSGALDLETFTDSAALSNVRHESASAAQMLPVYSSSNIESGNAVEIKVMVDE